MGQNITIQEKSEDEFEVLVADASGGSESAHTVHVDEAYVHELGWEMADVGTLIRESFEFLLEREPKESILREFDLRDIEKYFPEYKENIQN